jgi:Ca-activated chloride channel family protein
MKRQTTLTFVSLAVLLGLVFSACGGAPSTVVETVEVEGQPQPGEWNSSGADDHANPYADEFKSEGANEPGPYLAPLPTQMLVAPDLERAGNEESELGAGSTSGDPVQVPPSSGEVDLDGVVCCDPPDDNPYDDEYPDDDNPYNDDPYGDPYTSYPDFDPYGDDPYANVNFFDYGINPFFFTRDDNLSTFSMDVDTGSYTIARSYLNDGFMPPAASVRVEEFINYFDQGYPQPTGNDVFNIVIDGGATPFTGTPAYDMLRVGIQGLEIEAAERKPVALTFVVDVSGSMAKGERLEMVKDAMHVLVDELTIRDTVSIVAYSDSAWVVLTPTNGFNKGVIRRAINKLHPMNSTNAEAGLILGYKQANKSFDAEASNRVVLLSDGVANVGSTGPDSIWESMQRYADEGITLTTVGVGMGNYNDVLLEQLADNGNGFYAYIDTYKEAERLFSEDLVGTLQLIARDAKVQVVFNPEVVERYRLIGYENRDVADEDFNDPSVDAGEIGAGHSVTAMYEIKLHAGAGDASGVVATVVLHWEDPDTGRLHEIEETIFARDLADDFSRTSPTFQWAVIVTEYAEWLRGSYFAERTDMRALAEYANWLAERLDFNADAIELVELMEYAMWLMN